MLLLFESLQTPAIELVFKVTVQPGGLTDYVTVVVRDIGLDPITEEQLRQWLGAGEARGWLGAGAGTPTGKQYIGRYANTWDATWPTEW